MTVKKGVELQCVFRPDDVILLTRQGFTKDVTLHPLILTLSPPPHIIYVCMSDAFS